VKHNLTGPQAFDLAADALQNLLDNPPIPEEVDLSAEWLHGYKIGLTTAIESLKEFSKREREGTWK
jgi:hypothetical protein